ncbi:MAG: peptidylprolyl isomerase [SAR324 cluster bacterium]|nr:peptidylprolyl isomerase [SAR324 cluster bacterium]
MKFRIFFFIICFLIAKDSYVRGETLLLDYIKIVVNSEILTHSEVQGAIDDLRAQILRSIPPGIVRDQQLKELESTAVQNLVNELLVLDRARSKNIEVTEAEIEQHINRLAKDNPQITKIYDPDELKELVSKDFLKQRLIALEVAPKVHVSDAEIKVFCEESVQQNKEVEIAQILFRGSEEEAQTKTVLIKKALLEGTDFGQLAKTYSEDPNVKNNGGKLGRFQQGQLLAAIDEVAFSLKKKQLSPLIKTEVGFHLIYLLDVGIRGGADCDNLSPERRNQYYNQVYNQKHQQSLNDYLKELRKTAQIKIN